MSKHFPHSKWGQAQELARLRDQTFHTWREKATGEEDDVDITWIYQEQIVFSQPECLLCGMTVNSMDKRKAVLLHSWTLARLLAVSHIIYKYKRLQWCNNTTDSRSHTKLNQLTKTFKKHRKRFSKWYITSLEVCKNKISATASRILKKIN